MNKKNTFHSWCDFASICQLIEWTFETLFAEDKNSIGLKMMVTLAHDRLITQEPGR